jgi:hypothetical protein
MSGSLQCQLFLLRLKNACTTMSTVYLVNRDKNIQSMTDLGIDMSDVKAICMELVPGDQRVGPVSDDGGRPGEVWIFHPTYKGISMYLKLSLVSDGGTDHITIISCHREGMV